jgi:glc operon protein GlcG
MKNASLLAAAAALLAGSTGAHAAAVAQPAVKPLLSQRQVLSSYAAHRLVEACMQFGNPNVPIAIAVVDTAGNLLAFEAMEGSTETAIMTAQLKATTAARWRRPTSELFDRVNRHENRAPEFVGDFPQPGGFPIFSGTEVVGAVGAGGGAGTADDECAKHAIATVFGPNAVTARPN